jgi:elongation factor G
VLCRDDPSLKYVLDEDSGRVVLSGMGELHLEIAVDRLKREYKVEVLTGAASVSYRESIEQPTGTATVVYDKTMGTKRLFAGLTVTVRRTETASYSTDPPNISVSVKGDALLVEALKDGLKAASTRGPSMGRPLAGLDIECSSIQTDADTTPGAVRACAALALAEALKDATAVLLEPIMKLEYVVTSYHADVTNDRLALVPSSRLGDVLTDLAVQRRATVGDVAAQEGDRNTVKAHAPLANLIGYSTAIRSITAGDADFSVEYSHLAACPTPDLSSR